MGFMSRFLRLCRADIHGVLDRIEDKGLMLKLHLREMADELDRKAARISHMTVMKEDHKKEYDRTVQGMEKIEKDLCMALDDDKDDIARLLIKGLKALTNRKEKLEGVFKTLDLDSQALRKCLQAQRGQYEYLKDRAHTYFYGAVQGPLQRPLVEHSGLLAEADVAQEEIELELSFLKEKMQKEATP